MATESFYETMVIDTPEAAANLEALIESGICWEPSGNPVVWSTADDVRKALAEKQQ